MWVLFSLGVAATETRPDKISIVSDIPRFRKSADSCCRD